MTKNQSYTGIDRFRLAAAMLIVAIHTSPLASFSETADFILTRIIARVAVPFFFMTSGFFLISRYSDQGKELRAFEKKTAVIYGIAMALYVPLNIYSGYFEMDDLLPNIIKDIVFDGTLYHLWYLPASMLGAAIAWYSVRKLGFTKAGIFTAGLYIIGLFGDSYYGLSEKSGFFKGFYDLIFQVSDRTRNGVFMAPVFFVMGGALADRGKILPLKKSLCGFGVSFALMLAEALSLRHFALQRHDSMYLFLLPSMYFLFSALAHVRGKRLAAVRNASLVIYIIHPMMIVAVRLLSKLLRLESLLVENSLVHFLAVSLASVVFAFLALAVWGRCRPAPSGPGDGTERAYLEIDLNDLAHNVKTMKKELPQGCELMAVVKAQAYGHGMFAFATNLERMGVHAFAVATIDEGIRLRRYGISGEILVLGCTAWTRAGQLHKYDLTQTLPDPEYALQLGRQGYDIKAHVKVDTGMHRLGYPQEDVGGIAAAFSIKHIKITGIYTHLCVADSTDEGDVAFTQTQIEGFYSLIRSLKGRGIAIPKLHIQSSYGLLNYPQLKCDYVRAGLCLYGVLSAPGDKTRLEPEMKPVLSLRSRVVLLRNISKGDTVGYGRSFLAARDSLIAMLPIGYADGYPRSLSCQKGCVLIRGHRADIVGRICMDQLAVDVTDIPDVKVGDIATLIGKDGQEEITAPEVAQRSGSITNELLSRMGPRLKTVVRPWEGSL